MKRLTLVLCFLCICGVARADQMSYSASGYASMTTGATITQVMLQTPLNDIKTFVNGNKIACDYNIKAAGVTETCIAGDAVTTSKILDGAITSIKIATGAITLDRLSAGWATASFHGDLSSTLSTMHAASATAITNLSNYFNSTNTNGALWEIGKYVNYSSQSIALNRKVQKYFGATQNNGEEWPFSSPVFATITVSAGEAPAGITIEVVAFASATAGAGGWCQLGIAPRIKNQSTGVEIELYPLITAGVYPNYFWSIAAPPNGGTASRHSMSTVYSVADGFDPNVANLIYLGQPRLQGGANCVGYFMSNWFMRVWAN